MTSKFFWKKNIYSRKIKEDENIFRVLIKNVFIFFQKFFQEYFRHLLTAIKNIYKQKNTFKM